MVDNLLKGVDCFWSTRPAKYELTIAELKCHAAESLVDQHALDLGLQIGLDDDLVFQPVKIGEIDIDIVGKRLQLDRVVWT